MSVSTLLPPHLLQKQEQSCPINYPKTKISLHGVSPSQSYLLWSSICGSLTWKHLSSPAVDNQKLLPLLVPLLRPPCPSPTRLAPFFSCKLHMVICVAELHRMHKPCMKVWLSVNGWCWTHFILPGSRKTWIPPSRIICKDTITYAIIIVSILKIFISGKLVAYFLIFVQKRNPDQSWLYFENLYRKPCTAADLTVASLPPLLARFSICLHQSPRSAQYGSVTHYALWRPVWHRWFSDRCEDISSEKQAPRWHAVKTKVQGLSLSLVLM